MRPQLSKGDLGEGARQMICARLMLNGVKVFKPMTEDTPIDLLVLRGEDVLKCQCKYIYPNRRGSHTMNLYTVRKNGPGDRAHKHRYTRSEVDFFLGYCQENDAVYVLPHEQCTTMELRFWISRSPRGRCHHASFDATPWLNAFHLLPP